MIKLRLYKKRDLESLYAISLATGAKGADASLLHKDGKMIGHIYSAPYAVFSPETCFVAYDKQGVAGYIVGTLDTLAFEERLERDWWPELRASYPDPKGVAAEDWNQDQRRSHMIHHPRRTPADIAAHYPAHVHMNLLPRAQGQGIGRALLELWSTVARNEGANGMHVATSPANARAYRFWQSCGFEALAAHPPAAQGAAPQALSEQAPSQQAPSQQAPSQQTAPQYNAAVWLGRYLLEDSNAKTG